MPAHSQVSPETVGYVVNVTTVTQEEDQSRGHLHVFDGPRNERAGPPRRSRDLKERPYA